MQLNIKTQAHIHARTHTAEKKSIKWRSKHFTIIHNIIRLCKIFVAQEDICQLVAAY